LNFFDGSHFPEKYFAGIESKRKKRNGEPKRGNEWNKSDK